MLHLLSKKTASGDLYISLARQHLKNHEWGLAKAAIEQGMTKGHLSDPDKACKLLQDICKRMGIRSARQDVGSGQQHQ
jgi:hypothetical protein